MCTCVLKIWRRLDACEESAYQVHKQQFFYILWFSFISKFTWEYYVGTLTTQISKGHMVFMELIHIITCPYIQNIVS